MSLFDKLKKPFLTKEDEEYQMLVEVAEEYLAQKKKETPQNKSGIATETVVREHLLKKGFNLTLNPNVRIIGSNIRNDLLLLKTKVNPNQMDYPANEVDTVLEIKNNAVANQSERIRANFEQLKGAFPHLRFGVIVLSERKGYTHEITDEKLKDVRYRSFTLISRRIYPKTGGLYSKQAIVRLLENGELKKTGDWARLITYLKEA